MKVKVVSTKFIKPCTPTPQNLNKYKLSFTDELVPPTNMSVILFYPLINPNPNPKPTIQLQESLAKTLPLFYPLAGRYIKKELLVDCNDEGAAFVEAEVVDEELMDVIGKTKTNDQLNELLSRQSYEAGEATDPMLSIQITEFKCGGLAISINMSHSIADACSMATFIAAWSNNNANHPHKIFPNLDSRKLFPGKNLRYQFEPPRSMDPSLVIKRLLFNKEAITSLRSKLRPKHDGAQGLSYSRVRVVSALIAKALIGVDRAKKGESRDCYIAQPVNMRERTIPSLPEYSFGNLAMLSLTKCMGTATENMELFEELVYLFGDTIKKAISDCAELLSLGDDGVKKIFIDPIDDLVERSVSGEINIMWFSDWSKFRLYEADFGWGKPVWAIGTMFGKNLALLLENKEGDGIEAWVHLDKTDVPYFEGDEDMKLFTIT